MENTRVVTLETIAVRAGVSRSAVSLALRGRKGVSEKEKARIRGIAVKLGYRQNALVSAHMAYLRAGRLPGYQATLALLRFERNPHQGKRAAHLPDAQYCAGVSARAQELGYNLAEFCLDEAGMSVTRVASILRSRGIAGIILPPLVKPGLTVNFSWDQFAVVALGYSIASPNFHRACADIFSATGLLLEQVVLRGYRRIGVALFSDADTRVQHLALARFLAWQRTETPLPKLPALLLNADMGADHFRAWLKMQRPDVVITNAPEIARWLRLARRAVFRPIGLATTYWQEGEPEITGIHHDFPGIGAAAVDLLVGQLHRNELGLPASPRLLLIRSHWEEGRTLRPTVESFYSTG